MTWMLQVGQNKGTKCILAFPNATRRNRVGGHVHWTNRFLFLVFFSVSWTLSTAISETYTAPLCLAFINSALDCFQPFYPRLLPKVSICLVGNNAVDFGQTYFVSREVTILVWSLPMTRPASLKTTLVIEYLGDILISIQICTIKITAVILSEQLKGNY